MNKLNYSRLFVFGRWNYNLSFFVWLIFSTVLVKASTLSQIKGPEDQYVVPGQTAEFQVIQSDPGHWRYQWQKRDFNAAGFNDITGATAPNFVTPPASWAHSGTQYRCVMTDSTTQRSTTSAEAALVVNEMSFGLFRFDGFGRMASGGSSWFSRLLYPPQWQERERWPFFTKFFPDGSVLIQNDTPEIMEQEIAYAMALSRNGSKPFWIFPFPFGEALPGYYDGHDWQMAVRNIQHYNESARVGDMDFCYYVAFGEETAENVARWTRDMQRPNYKRVNTKEGRRPVLYFYDYYPGPEDIYPGGWDDAKLVIEHVIIAPMLQAGLPRPYLVVLTLYPDRAPLFYQAGFEEVSTYAFFPDEADMPYSRFASMVESAWDAFKSAGFAVMPTIGISFDPRPHRNDPWHGFSGKYCRRAQPQPFGEHARRALAFLRQNKKAAKAKVTVTTWNEYSEGHFLCVTADEAQSGDSLLNVAAAAFTEDLTGVEFSREPQSQAVREGEQSRFLVTAVGRGPLQYQWQKNGVNIPGATSPTYATGPAVLSDHGAKFQCVVRAKDGSARTSAQAILTVNVAGRQGAVRKIEAYPNPWIVKDSPYLTLIHAAGPTKFRIFTQQGRLVETLSADERGVALWSNPPSSGLYIVVEEKSNETLSVVVIR